jgi:hypothetical protein
MEREREINIRAARAGKKVKTRGVAKRLANENPIRKMEN